MAQYIADNRVQENPTQERWHKRTIKRSGLLKLIVGTYMLMK